MSHKPTNDTRSRPMTAEAIHTCSYSCERPGCIRAQRDELVAKVEALRAEVERLRTDGASAVRWAPGSAYWSEVLVELFGPDARKGIDVLEARWRKEIERAERLAEALKEIRSRSAMNLAMRSDHPELTARLGDIYQIADAALSNGGKA